MNDDTTSASDATKGPEAGEVETTGTETAPRRGRRRAASRPAGPPAVVFSAAPVSSTPETPPTRPVAAVVAVFQAPDLTPAPAVKKSGGASRTGADQGVEGDVAATNASDATGGDTTDREDNVDGEGRPAAGRRRRRGGRGRRRKTEGGSGENDGSSASDADAQPDSATPDAATSEDSDGDSDGKESQDKESQGTGPEGNGGNNQQGEGGTRRRRRRRRRGAGGGDSGGEDDPPNTVVRVREPRRVSDEVTAVKGSTRLEAKKQRRREGRESRGRRAPILTEAEFLSRRESVDRRMVVRQRGEVIQIGVLEDEVLVEHYVSNSGSGSMIGNVYLGKVQNVLPSMEAAFVDIGRGRNAVLYAGEVNWDAAGLEGQPKRIELALKSGDSVLVQVTKDPIGHKGARLTSQISLPGRFLVYVPEGGMTGISRKLPDRERSRLKKILRSVMPENSGVIVRTAAEGASEEELSNDVARLAEQWQALGEKVASGNAPCLLRAEPDLAIKVVRDIFNEDFAGMVISGDSVYSEVRQYVDAVAPDLADRVTKWTKNEDIFTEFRVDEQLAKALDRKVWLPSGGSLVIDRTEAMTVVDVNTGKFTGKGGNLEETVTRNNLEAAEEMVRQLRLRDIGGIIVIDFIDMVLESNRDLVLRRLVECLSRDRTKHQVAEVTTLGLVQMTRKRIGQGLLETFSEPCESCAGRGVKVHLDTHSSPTGDSRVHRTRRPKVTGPIPGAPRVEPAVTPEAEAEVAPEEAGDAKPAVDAQDRGPAVDAQDRGPAVDAQDQGQATDAETTLETPAAVDSEVGVAVELVDAEAVAVAIGVVP